MSFDSWYAHYKDGEKEIPDTMYEFLRDAWDEQQKRIMELEQELAEALIWEKQYKNQWNDTCDLNDDLRAERDRLREAAQDFVDKVECGQGFSRSKVSTANSYAKFKKALEDSDEL